MLHGGGGSSSRPRVSHGVFTSPSNLVVVTLDVCGRPGARHSRTDLPANLGTLLHATCAFAQPFAPALNIEQKPALVRAGVNALYERRSALVVTFTCEIIPFSGRRDSLLFYSVVAEYVEQP